MPVGRLVQRVPRDQHSAGTFGLIEAQQEVGKPDYGATTLVPAPPNSFRQRVVGPMRKRVAVDDEEGPCHGDRCSSFSSTTSAGFLSSRNPTIPDDAFHQRWSTQ